MINNKFTKIAMATLLASSTGNILGASASEEIDAVELKFRGATFLATPTKAAELQKEIDECPDTVSVKKKAGQMFKEKQGTLPDSTIGILEKATERRMMTDKNLKVNKLLNSLEAASAQLKSKEKKFEHDLEVKKLTGILDTQRLEASELDRKFKSLQLQMRQKQAQIQQIEQMSDLERVALAGALEEYQLQLEGLTQEHIQLQNELSERTLQYKEVKSQVDAYAPLVNAVKNGGGMVLFPEAVVDAAEGASASTGSDDEEYDAEVDIAGSESEEDS